MVGCGVAVHAEVKFGDYTLKTEVIISLNVFLQSSRVNAIDIEMALQSDSVDRYTAILKTLGEIIEGFCLGVAFELHTVVVEDEHGISTTTYRIVVLLFSFFLHLVFWLQ